VSKSLSGRGARAVAWPVTSPAPRGAIFGAVLGAVLGMSCQGAVADTLEWALVQAYQNNPSLNAQRASLRSMDEGVPQALSGYRPKVAITANGGYDYASTLSHTVNQS